jgi:hypothetical protein
MPAECTQETIDTASNVLTDVINNILVSFQKNRHFFGNLKHFIQPDTRTQIVMTNTEEVVADWQASLKVGLIIGITITSIFFIIFVAVPNGFSIYLHSR